MCEKSKYCPEAAEEELKDFLWEFLRFTDGQSIQKGAILVSRCWDGKPDSETKILLSHDSKEIIL